MSDTGEPRERRFAFDALGFGNRPTPRVLAGRVAGTAVGLLVIVVVHEGLETGSLPIDRLPLLAGVMLGVAVAAWTPVYLVARRRSAR